MPAGMTTYLTDASNFVYPRTSYDIVAPTSNLPTKDDYKRGFLYRHLFRLQNPYDYIKECDESTYIRLQNNTLYSSVRVKWKIIGPMSKAREINENIVKNSNIKLPGSEKYLLKDTLMYWKNIKDPVEDFDVTEKIKSSPLVTEQPNLVQQSQILPGFTYPAGSYVVILPVANIPTVDDYKRGFMYRYLFRLTNPYDYIKECDKDTYTGLQSNNLYISIKLRWKIIGTISKAREINETIAKNSDVKFPGSGKYLLKNILMHWKDIKDPVTEFDVTEKMKSTNQMVDAAEVSSKISVPIAEFVYPASSYVIVQSISNLPTGDDYKKGFMYRYLFRLASNPYDYIKECDEETYNNKLRNNVLYSSIKIRWKIIGTISKTREINETIAGKAAIKLSGVKGYLLRDSLLYWKDIKDHVLDFDITDRMKSTQQTMPSTDIPITTIEAINRNIGTESVINILTEEYDDMIVEDNTYL